jgi:hypothetical protein
MPPTDTKEAVRVQLSHAYHEPRGKDEHRDEGERGHHHSSCVLAEIDIV